MKSVVTGGGGFLGRHIVELLRSRGDTVVVLARQRYKEFEQKGVSQVQCDIRDREGVEHAFQGADQVFHVAARVGMWGDWRSFYETNVIGTENVIEACLKNRVPKLIYTSSPSVVFNGEDHEGVDESHSYAHRWLAHYPHTKKLAEEKVLAANAREGLSTIALRPHLIWGKGDPHLIPRVLEQARKGKLLRVGSGKNRVDMIHVKNAADAHLRAGLLLGKSSTCAGKAYFLSQGDPVLLWDFIGEILNRFHVKKISKSVSFTTAYRLGAALEWSYRLTGNQREPRMTRFLAQTLAKHHYYDISAAKRDLGYSPQITTDEGLRELV